MFPTLASARSTVLSALTSPRAVAASLLAGTLLATGVLPADAHAQRKKKDEQEQPAAEQNSAAFATAYRPLVEMVTGETKDWQGAAARVPSLLAAIENDRDRSVAGTFLLQAGTNTGNDALRRQGLTLMHESGLLSDNDKPLVAFNLGIFAYQADERNKALEYFLEARELGYTDNDSEPFNDVEYLILQSYTSEDRHEEAIAFGLPIAQQAEAAGSAMPDPFLRQILQAALDLDDGVRSREIAALLVKAYPTVDSWQLATRITQQFTDYSDNEALDLYRLMFKLGTMEDRREYSSYLSAANENLRPVEILEVLSDGIARDVYPSDDQYVVSLRNQVTPSARRQRADMDEAFIDAREGGGNNTDILALNVGDQLLAVDDYDRAITLYGLAKQRGLDPNLADTRMGMAQIMAGDYGAGMETLAGVSGRLKPIADLWSLYAEIEGDPMAEAAAALDEAAEAVEAAEEAVEQAS